MGLLTNPNAGSGGIVSLLERHYLRLGWLCYVIGVAGIFIFPYPEFSHKTYFSENALLPGLVKGEFNEERAMHRLVS
jgi:glycosylphosphatidylinositol transamidase